MEPSTDHAGGGGVKMGVSCLSARRGDSDPSSFFLSSPVADFTGLLQARPDQEHVLVFKNPITWY